MSLYLSSTHLECHVSYLTVCGLLCLAAMCSTVQPLLSLFWGVLTMSTRFTMDKALDNLLLATSLPWDNLFLDLRTTSLTSISSSYLASHYLQLHTLVHTIDITPGTPVFQNSAVLRLTLHTQYKTSTTRCSLTLTALPWPGPVSYLLSLTVLQTKQDKADSE